MPDTPYNDALDVLATALKAGPAALAHQSGPAARTNFVDRLTTIAHRLDLGGHGGVQEVYEAASIIGRLQKGRNGQKGATTRKYAARTPSVNDRRTRSRVMQRATMRVCAAA